MMLLNYCTTTPATLYITYDFYEELFIITLPISNFTWTIFNEHDYKKILLLKIDELNSDKKNKLVELVKNEVDKWKELERGH